MVLAGMTHQAVAYHFNVSRITISRRMVRVKQTSRANDIPRSGRSRVTSQRQDRHIRLIHLLNFMIMSAGTASRTHSLANNRISGQTFRRKLCESGHRARHQVVGPIFKQRHRTARLAWACAHRHWRASHLPTHPF